jgi:hypothetical protein
MVNSLLFESEHRYPQSYFWSLNKILHRFKLVA